MLSLGFELTFSVGSTKALKALGGQEQYRQSLVLQGLSFPSAVPLFKRP